MDATALRDDDGPRFYCLSCHDELHNWRPFWCPGAGGYRTMDRPDYTIGSIVDCGRTKAHGPHAYVARCECADTNPVSARRREREARERVERQRRRAS
jgi:hypothetical protein